MSIKGTYRGIKITFVTNDLMLAQTSEGVILTGPKSKVIKLIDNGFFK